MVGAFEQALLALMIFVIMLGMGASLTPRDFYLALRRPQGLAIGVVSQYGFMPLVGFTMAQVFGLPDAIALGLLIVACMPGGTTSNIFTYFSKGNLALSVLMTVTSTVFGVILIPLVLVVYAAALDLEIPRENIVTTLVILLVPVAIGMLLRRLDANIGAVTEFFGSALALFFIAFIALSWVPRNWQFLMTTAPTTYLSAILLGLIGMALGYAFARTLRLRPRTARTVALETGIQNAPLAIAIIVLTFPAEEQQSIIAVGALYSLFIVISSTFVTLWFRRLAASEAQDMPSGLL